MLKISLFTLLCISSSSSSHSPPPPGGTAASSAPAGGSPGRQPQCCSYSWQMSQYMYTSTCPEEAILIPHPLQPFPHLQCLPCLVRNLSGPSLLIILIPNQDQRNVCQVPLLLIDQLQDGLQLCQAFLCGNTEHHHKSMPCRGR